MQAFKALGMGEGQAAAGEGCLRGAPASCAGCDLWLVDVCGSSHQELQAVLLVGKLLPLQKM